MKVTRQFPLTLTDQLSFRLPFNGCGSNPGSAMSRGSLATQSAKDKSKPAGVFRIYSGRCAVHEKTLQSLMSEFENRHNKNGNM